MMECKRLATALALLVVVAGPGRGAVAATGAEQGTGPTPPRLSFTDGEVSFWRPGAEEWTPAKANTPLAAGDALYAGDHGNLELQLGPGAFVRGGAGTEIGLQSSETNLRQFKLTSGHVAVDLSRLGRGQVIEVDTPNGAFTIESPGYYRVDVEEDRTTFSARRGGRATLVPADGEATDVDPDTQVVLEGAQTPKVTSSPAPDPDEWDRWNGDRTARASEPSRSAPYVSPEVAGREDLDHHGDWRETPRYGHVWVPREVPPDWAPYSTGRWLWDPYYGWTWVDDAPWGWAPYHYGRWVHDDGFWGWAPGPVVVAPAYAPALVAFFGPHVSVSVGLPFVSWVALGFGEPLIPWWGPVGFSGRCWWGGWGGPHIVNNVVIQRNTFVNVRNVTVFRNQTVRNGVIAVDRAHFGRGRVDRVRLGETDARGLRPIRGQLGVKPTPASLVARDGRGIRPGPGVHERAVIATRPPQDVSRRGAARQGPLDARTTPPPPPGAEHHHPGQAGTRVRPPARDVGSERREPGPSRERGAPQPRGEASHVPPPPARAPQHATPQSPHRVERQLPAPPSPPHHVEHGGPARSGPPPQGGSPPYQAPRERAAPQPAPHERPHELAPGGSPSARWNAPGQSRAWVGGGRAESVQLSSRRRPTGRRAPSRRPPA
jgi:hypothetical protein